MRAFLFAAILFACAIGVPAPAAEPVIKITTPMSPPEWALLERALLAENSAACREFYERYFDDRGFLECVVRWGGDDGPDDAIECCADWPLLHALGGDDEVFKRYERAWEGHLRQFTAARTTAVEFAREGMYYREFPVMFDWVHHGEGLTAFNFHPLSHPHDARHRQRVERFASFYTGEDPTAPNYDADKHLIRSLFNGSRGPLLRQATALDWAGDPIQIEGRFRPLHGERTYDEMLAHFQDYEEIVGDHPQNLCATGLAANAYLLTHEGRYKDWLLGYVDAWAARAQSNGGILPSNIGLDGTIGGECGGRWYGGVYGWNFTVRVPQTGEMAHRNTTHLGLNGFGHALLLSGNQKYVNVWRAQIDAVNAAAKAVDGVKMYPRMYGDDGWYAFNPEPYRQGALEVFYWSQRADDRDRVGPNGWLDYLVGENEAYPVAALRGDLARVRGQSQAMRDDTTTPDTRLADDPLVLSPVAVQSLVSLTLGGLYPGHSSSLLHCRVRYFDPERRRAGLPRDVAALVERMSDTHTTLTLVNLDQGESRRVAVQAGAYGEHRFGKVTIDDASTPVDDRGFTVELSPGCGARLHVTTSRFANDPTLSQPWDN